MIILWGLRGRMPRKFKGSKRRFRRFFKRKKYNALSKHIGNEKRLCRLRLMWGIPITSDATVGVKFIQSIFPLNFPNHAWLDNGTAGGGSFGALQANGTVTSSDIYQRFLNTGSQALFDLYKVNQVSVRFVPATLDVNNNNTTGVGPAYTLTMFHYNDPDDSSNFVTYSTVMESKFLNSGAYPINYNANTQRSVNFVFKQKKQDRHVWLNTAMIQNNNVITSGLNPTFSNLPMACPFGSLKTMIKGYNNAASLMNLGTLYVTWDVTFKGISSLL